MKTECLHLRRSPFRDIQMSAFYPKLGMFLLNSLGPPLRLLFLSHKEVSLLFIMDIQDYMSLRNGIIYGPAGSA